MPPTKQKQEASGGLGTLLAIVIGAMALGGGGGKDGGRGDAGCDVIRRRSPGSFSRLRAAGPVG